MGNISAEKGGYLCGEVYCGPQKKTAPLLWVLHMKSAISNGITWHLAFQMCLKEKFSYHFS